MRITGGRAGGRRVESPKGLEVRPTPDRVKQAIFNSLGERVPGARVLELFAGSGALGLESLSRGAVSLVSVEKSGRQGMFIRRNLEALGLGEGGFELRIQDAFTAVEQLAAGGRRFDLILADPPYGEKVVDRRSESFAQALLDDRRLPGLLEKGGVLVLGHARRDRVEVTDWWEERRALKHGDTVMLILANRELREGVGNDSLVG